MTAILDGTHRQPRVLIVDQSDDDSTFEAIERFLPDPRFMYVRVSSRGLSHARNAALRLAGTELVAFTDDDCVPEAAWLEGLLAEAATVDGPAMFFGPLVPDADSMRVGMVPGWRPGEAGRVSARWTSYTLGGFGGNMAINRAAIELTGKFNPLLGRGAPFPSAEEGEYAFRVVNAGGTVVELNSPSVVHYGPVPWPKLRAALRHDFRATGRMLAWCVRRGEMNALMQLAFCLRREAHVVGGQMVRRRRPLGLRRPCWLLSGFVAGLVLGQPAAAAVHAAKDDVVWISGAGEVEWQR